MRRFWRIALGVLVFTFLHMLVSFIYLKAKYETVTMKQRIVTADGKFHWIGLLSPVQMEGKTVSLKTDTVTATQRYVWGEKFTTVDLVAGQATKAQEWTDSLIKNFGDTGMVKTNYLYGKSELAQKVHGLDEILKGKKFLSLDVVGYASPEAGTPQSLMTDSIEQSNITLAENRAQKTVGMIRGIFSSNGKNIDSIKTTTSGVELQLNSTDATALATPQGFAAVKASNRSGKDTMGFQAHTLLSSKRYTEVTLKYTEDKGKAMVITQPLLLLLMSLLALRFLPSLFRSRKSSEEQGEEKYEEVEVADEKPKKRGFICCLCSKALRRLWRMRINHFFRSLRNWFKGCKCTGGSWKCCLCNKALRRLWRMRFNRFFRNLRNRDCHCIWWILALIVTNIAWMWLYLAGLLCR